MAEHKILQIMPAAGWGAVFVEGEDELITPLAGWALVTKEDGSSAVMGLVAWERVELAEHDVVEVGVGGAFAEEGVCEADLLELGVGGRCGGGDDPEARHSK